jgi:hypothetical protein
VVLVKVGAVHLYGRECSKLTAAERKEMGKRRQHSVGSGASISDQRPGAPSFEMTASGAVPRRGESPFWLIFAYVVLSGQQDSVLRSSGTNSTVFLKFRNCYANLVSEADILQVVTSFC